MSARAARRHSTKPLPARATPHEPGRNRAAHRLPARAAYLRAPRSSATTACNASGVAAAAAIGSPPA
ncbi:hypothetical protein, partial [Burkholderia pseudomallei]|uniref:hypothetical protein n=1 Tax=Burkholderia pseudomallei TaxID=28450 RepID=UPI001C4AF5F0